MSSCCKTPTLHQVLERCNATGGEDIRLTRGSKITGRKTVIEGTESLTLSSPEGAVVVDAGELDLNSKKIGIKAPSIALEAQDFMAFSVAAGPITMEATEVRILGSTKYVVESESQTFNAKSMSTDSNVIGFKSATSFTVDSPNFSASAKSSSITATDPGTSTSTFTVDPTIVSTLTEQLQLISQRLTEIKSGTLNVTSDLYSTLVQEFNLIASQLASIQATGNLQLKSGAAYSLDSQSMATSTATDYVEQIGRDHKKTIMGSQEARIDKDHLVDVGANYKSTVGGEYQVSIQGPSQWAMAKSYAVQVGEDSSLTVQGDERTTAGRNRQVTVGADHMLDIGGSLFASVVGTHISKSGSHFLDVGTDQKVDVGGSSTTSVAGLQSTKIGKDREVEVGGTGLWKIGANHRVEVTGTGLWKTGADHQVEVGGSSTTTVVGPQFAKIGSDRQVEVGGTGLWKIGADHQVEVGGACTTTVVGPQFAKIGSDREVEVGGTGLWKIGADQRVQVGGVSTTDVAGSVLCKVGADNVVQVGGGEVLTTVGSRSVVIGGDSGWDVARGINIKAQTFTVTAPHISLVGAVDVSGSLTVATPLSYYAQFNILTPQGVSGGDTVASGTWLPRPLTSGGSELAQLNPDGTVSFLKTGTYTVVATSSFWSPSGSDASFVSRLVGSDGRVLLGSNVYESGDSCISDFLTVSALPYTASLEYGASAAVVTGLGHPGVFDNNYVILSLSLFP